MATSADGGPYREVTVVHSEKNYGAPSFLKVNKRFFFLIEKCVNSSWCFPGNWSELSRRTKDESHRNEIGEVPLKEVMKKLNIRNIISENVDGVRRSSSSGATHRQAL